MSAELAFLDMFGGPEIMLIMVVVLIFFGGEKLPGFARGLGKAIRELKKAASDVENEFKRAIDETERRPAMPPRPPINVTPQRIEPSAGPHVPAPPLAAPPTVPPVPPSRLPDDHYDQDIE